MSTSKIFYVANAIQAALMTEVFIHEFTDGFWKGQRPVGHGDVWKDVEVKVTEDGNIGPSGFKPARMYNFLNPEFVKAMEDRMVEVAKTVTEDITFKRIKPELAELSRTIGGRLTNVSEAPIKLFRGNHRDGTKTTSSSKAREAGAKLTEAANEPITKVEKGQKRTVTKATNGATTTRVEVATVTTNAFPFATTETAQVEEIATSEAEAVESTETSASAE